MPDLLSNPTAATEITGRAEFSELLMLLNHARGATFVFALYDTAGVREEISEAITRIIAPTPVFTWRYDSTRPFPASYLDRLSPEQRKERAVVIFDDLERGDDKAWKSLDHNRNHFAKHPHTLLFWVTQKGRVDVATKAPHFWAQRSVVFDFLVEQPERHMGLRTEWADRSLVIENFVDAEQQLGLYRGLLEEFREMPDVPPLTLADLNGKVARLLTYLRRYEEALPFLSEQLMFVRQAGDRNLEAESLLNLAKVKRLHLGRFASFEEIQKALDLADSSELRANVLLEMALSHLYEANTNQSFHLLEEALALFTQIGDKIGQANAQKIIGDAQSLQNKDDAALVSYSTALDIFKQVGDRLGQANVQKAIGDVQSFRGNKQAALNSYEEAHALFVLIGDKTEQANIEQAIEDVQSFRKSEGAMPAGSYLNIVASQLKVNLHKSTEEEKLLVYAEAIRVIRQNLLKFPLRDLPERSIEFFELTFREINLGLYNLRNAHRGITQVKKYLSEALVSINVVLEMFHDKEEEDARARLNNRFVHLMHCADSLDKALSYLEALVRQNGQGASKQNRA